MVSKAQHRSAEAFNASYAISGLIEMVEHDVAMCIHTYILGHALPCYTLLDTLLNE